MATHETIKKKIQQANGTMKDFSKKSIEKNILKGTSYALKYYKNTEEYGVTKVTFWIGPSKLMYLSKWFRNDGMRSYVKDVQSFYFDTKSGECLEANKAEELKQKRGKVRVIGDEERIENELRQLEKDANERLEEERRRDEEEIMKVYLAVQAELLRIVERENLYNEKKKQDDTERDNEKSERRREFENESQKRIQDQVRKREQRMCIMLRNEEMFEKAKKSNNNVESSKLAIKLNEEGMDHYKIGKTKEDEKKTGLAIKEYRNAFGKVKESHSIKQLDEIFDSLRKIVEAFIKIKSFKNASEALEFIENSYLDKIVITKELRTKIPTTSSTGAQDHLKTYTTHQGQQGRQVVLQNV